MRVCECAPTKMLIFNGDGGLPSIKMLIYIDSPSGPLLTYLNDKQYAIYQESGIEMLRLNYTKK